MRAALLTALALVACGESTPEPGTPEKPMPEGQRIYEQHCVLCHGESGGLMMSGAKDLRVSALSREEAVAVVTSGRNGMMPYSNVLKPAEIDAVVDHVLTLRKTK